LTITGSDQGQTQIEPSELFISVEGKGTLQALTSLGKSPYGVLSSPHITPNPLTKGVTVIGVSGVFLRGTLKIGKGHIVIAGEISFSSGPKLTINL